LAGDTTVIPFGIGLETDIAAQELANMDVTQELG